MWWRFIESWFPMYCYSDITFVQSNMSSIQIYLDDNHSVSCNSSCSKFSVPSKRWRFLVKWWRFSTDTGWRWILQKECTFRYILSPGVDNPAMSFSHIWTGWCFYCSPQISVLKRKTLFNQRGSFVHREFHGTQSLIGCPSFFILVLKIGRNS